MFRSNFESFKKNIGIQGKPKAWKTTIYIQRIFLSHPRRGKRFEPIQHLKFLSWQVVLAFPCYVGLWLHLVKTSSSEVFSERLVSLSLIIQSSIQIFCMLSYIHFGNEFMALGDRLKSKKFGRPKKLLLAFMRFNHLSFSIYCSLCIFVLMYSIHHYYFNMYCDGRRILNDKRYVCGLTTPIWYPFEIDSEGVRLFLAFLFFVIALLMIPHATLGPVFATSVITFVKVRVEDLKDQIELVENVRDEHFSKKFKYFLDYYTYILGCVDDMNNCLGYCMIPEYTLNNLGMALLVYNIVIGRNYMELGPLFVWLLIQSLFCFSGQALENEHALLIDSIYNLPWYEMAPEDKLNYKIFLGQIQIPIHVKAIPLADLNNQFLLTVLHGTYSLLMFFLKFDE